MECWKERRGIIDTFGTMLDVFLLRYSGPPVVPGGMDGTAPAPGERLCEMHWRSHFLTITLDSGPCGNSFATCFIKM